jgi:ribosomal protein S18 acetylase RimI-like enzyme
MSLIYKVGTASREQMRQHLQVCDDNFTPPLSSRVDLDAYTDKLFEKAVSWEAWDGELLVGMLNVYLNDRSSRTGYLTNITVLREYLGQGIGSALMKMGLEYAWKLGFERVRAEMWRDNPPMHRLVATAGFRVVDDRGDWVQIECERPTSSSEGPR